MGQLLLAASECRQRVGIILAAALLLGLTGCAVPQPRGEGRLERVVEPTTRRPYYLYLPKDYVTADDAGRAARRWPLVVTFHGMKPYDTAYYQALEWEQEADRYGFIVAAPVLNAFDFFFGEFPLRRINGALKSDEQATLAILDHVFQTTRADPNHVLATSWSSGGYMAHYVLNRHPDRFTCLAVRQSNFAAVVLDGAKTSQSLYHPVLVLTTQNDIGICRVESREAIRWYEGYGYKNFAWVHISRLGHERTPDTAADFFARVAGVTPTRPPRVLVARQAIDGNPTGLALLAGNMGQMQKPPGAQSPDPTLGARAAPPAQGTTPRRPVMTAGTPAAATVAAEAPAATPPPTPARPTETPQKTLSPLGVRVSSAVGFEPLLLVYSADCPAEWHRTADFLWTLNGKKIGHGVNGQRTITEPGDYTLEVLVVTPQGAEHRASRRIRVLRHVETSVAPAANSVP